MLWGDQAPMFCSHGTSTWRLICRIWGCWPWWCFTGIFQDKGGGQQHGVQIWSELLSVQRLWSGSCSETSNQHYTSTRGGAGDRGADLRGRNPGVLTAAVQMLWNEHKYNNYMTYNSSTMLYASCTIRQGGLRRLCAGSEVSGESVRCRSVLCPGGVKASVHWDGRLWSFVQ